MFQKPRAAKRLYVDVIPRAVDDYLSHLQSYDAQAERRMESPVWHIHNGEPPKPGTKLSFGMLLNLASVCNTEDPAVLWGFITRYAPRSEEHTSELQSLMRKSYAVFCLNKKTFKHFSTHTTPFTSSAKQ